MSEHDRHRHGKHSGSSRRKSGVGSFLRANLIEIAGAAAIALGVFLVLGRMNIRSTLSRWATLGGANALRLLGNLNEAASSLVSRIQLSDVVGLVMIVVALVAIVLRLRWRLERAPSLTTLLCPRCGSGLHRIHRRSYDRLLSGVVPVRRYRCSNSECRWSGIRVAVGRHSQEATTAALPPAAPTSTR